MILIVMQALLLNIALGVSSLCAQDVVTHPERSDGFGAQFQTIIDSVIYAELTGKKYVYTPFSTMEHNYDNDPLFLQKKEWLINFIDNFELRRGDVVIPAVPTLIQYFEKYITRAVKSASLKKIKALFRANKNKHDYLSPGKFHIAVHIRRPNPHDNRILGVDTPDNVFLHAIEKLRIRYKDRAPVFHIYSQGDIQHFNSYLAHDVILHLDEPLETTFPAMVFADVLITSPSSLSYVAGILSDGQVYYVPFWHKPLPGWISIN